MKKGNKKRKFVDKIITKGSGAFALRADFVISQRLDVSSVFPLSRILATCRNHTTPQKGSASGKPQADMSRSGEASQDSLLFDE
jgi:hypothetical protein